ncbi:hypothetical protein K3495_g5666 [Podosphaera aphanis]|nr:hypothetical protein K3495_g5666 [Podosphaera aphanis]
MGNSDVFRIPCSLVKDGISINILALPDSGAHGFCFIDRQVTQSACDGLNLHPYTLAKPITPKGYNGVPGRIITKFVVFTMKIDGHTLDQTPFLVLDLGNQDVILGDGWMAHFDVLPDRKNRKLFWRTPPIQKISFAGNLQIPRSLLRKPNPLRCHQLNANRWSQLMEHDDKRRLIGSRSGVGAMGIKLLSTKQVTFDECESTEIEPIPQYETSLNCLNNRSTTKVNISEISGPTYNIIARHKGNQAFTVSLKEIDCEWSDWFRLEKKTKSDDLLMKLPRKYHDYLGVFLKQASDTLSPYRQYDHKIELEKDGELGYGPLYNQFTAELKAVKEYLLENLERRVGKSSLHIPLEGYLMVGGTMWGENV